MDDEQPLSLILPPDGPDTPEAFDAFDTADAPDAMDSPAPGAQEDTQGVVFLAPSPSIWRLSESVVYRPGVVVAVALLAGPAVCAIAGAIIAGMSGAVPVWLPLVLLLWLPALALAWALLKSVRVTPDALASGRPLGQWRSIPFDEIDRVEQHGLRLIVRSGASRPLTFTPALLHGGAQLRRGLLLRLPLPVLVGALRSQAQSLSEGDLLDSDEGDISGVLTVRPRAIWSALAGAAVIALGALAVVGLIELAWPLSGALALALVALAGLFCYFSLWSVQEIFVSAKGLVIRYRTLRRERDIIWTQVSEIAYTPGEMALLFRSPDYTVICAGPGLLSAPQARLMRQFFSRYCLSPIVPALKRSR